MILRRMLVATGLLAAGISTASAWTHAEIDAAVADNVDLHRLQSCALRPNEKLLRRVETTDFDKDGIEEIVVYDTIGPSKCLGENGRQVNLLISDGHGGWRSTVIPSADNLKLLARSDSVWPDIEADDYNFCVPIWRHDGTDYNEWKRCTLQGELELVSTAAAVSKPSKSERKADRDNGPYPVEVVDIGAFDGMPFDHNGSMMLVNPDKGMIVYVNPKPSIARTVKPGTVLFRGDRWNMGGDTSGVVLNGIAFTFKRGCDAAGYNVRGRFSLEFGMRQFVLEGPAPVRAKKGCAVPFYDAASPNAKLKFDLAWD